MSGLLGDALPLGHQLDEFIVTRVLGQGGFGITYKALDVRLQREVAIKEYLPSQFAARGNDSTVLPRADDHNKLFEWGLKRFVDEARALAKFRHPNIVAVIRYFEANGTAYLVMEYEEGCDLEAWLSEHPDGMSDILVDRIVLPLLDGLEKVHDKGLLHRDIKPANIFMRRDGTPVLIDFGASRAHGANATTTLTSLISAGYSPFEQYGQAGRQGPWSDLYSLAGTCYRVVAGRPPPDAIARHQGAPLIPAVEIGRGRHDRKFLETLDRALALDPTHRPQSAAEFRASVLGREAPVGKPAAVSHATIPRERNVVAGLSFPVTRRWGLNLGAVGLLVAIGGVLALRPDLREQLLPPYGSAETTLSGAQTPSSEAAEGQADPSSGDAAPQGRGGRPASQDGSRSAGRIAAGRPPRASVDTPEPQDTSGPANTIAEGALPQPPVDVPGPEGAPQPATTMADSGQPQATAETPATDADAAAESTEQKGKGVRVAEGIISGLALAAGIVGANEANKRERRAAHTQPPNSVPPPPGYAVPPPPPHTLAAPPVQFVLRCVFPGDSNSYYVTSTNEIVSISPNGQAVTIGARVAATAPGYEWMYQTPRLLYGVVNGQIYASAPDGRPRQVGYITNP